MPFTIEAQENEVVITFTALTLAQVQAYLTARQSLLTTLRWRVDSITGPGAGPLRATLHRTLTTGDQTALEQAMS